MLADPVINSLYHSFLQPFFLTKFGETYFPFSLCIYFGECGCNKTPKQMHDSMLWWMWHPVLLWHSWCNDPTNKKRGRFFYQLYIIFSFSFKRETYHFQKLLKYKIMFLYGENFKRYIVSLVPFDAFRVTSWKLYIKHNIVFFWPSRSPCVEVIIYPYWLEINKILILIFQWHNLLKDYVHKTWTILKIVLVSILINISILFVRCYSDIFQTYKNSYFYVKNKKIKIKII
jgi:hypothetical protein